MPLARSESESPATSRRVELALRAAGVLLVALAIRPLVDSLVHGFRLINWNSVASYPIGTTGLLGRWVDGLASQFSPSAFAAWLLFALPWILGISVGYALIRKPPRAARNFLATRCA